MYSKSCMAYKDDKFKTRLMCTIYVFRLFESAWRCSTLEGHSFKEPSLPAMSTSLGALLEVMAGQIGL